jgi:hypothetical protein
MRWLAILLILALQKFDGVSSTSANQTFSSDDSFDARRSNISANVSISDIKKGLKPQFKMHRDDLSVDQILTRRIDLPTLRVYNGDPATLGKIPFIVSTLV